MSCGIVDILRYETGIIIVFGGLLFCYSKSLKHLMASRCTRIKLGCIVCDRDPLDSASAREIVEVPDSVDVGPFLRLEV
jgi:hypothetical protein